MLRPPECLPEAQYQDCLNIIDVGVAASTVLERYRPCDYVYRYYWVPVWFVLVRRKWDPYDVMALMLHSDWDPNQCTQQGTPMLFLYWPEVGHLHADQVVKLLLEAGYDAMRLHPYTSRSILEHTLVYHPLGREQNTRIGHLLLDAGCRLDRDKAQDQRKHMSSLFAYADEISARVAACRACALALLLCAKRRLGGRDLAGLVGRKVWGTRRWKVME